MATPGPNKGSPMHRNSSQVLRPRSWQTARSSSGARVWIISGKMIACLVSGRPRTQTRSIQK
eukprot:6848563-Alexandrium_andersonii.AAC.1